MAKQIPMPQMGFDMTEGTIASWLKKEGEAVTKGEPIAEIETDKTTIQIEAFQSGVLLKQLAQPGQKVPVGESIGVIGDVGESVPASPAPASPAPASAPAANGSAAPVVAAPAAAPSAPAAVANTGRVIATPVAKRIAEERGVDLRLVTGTGPEGRIVKADVEGFAPTSVPSAKPADVAVPMPATPVVAPLQAAPPTAADAQIAAIAAAAASGGQTRRRCAHLADEDAPDHCQAHGGEQDAGAALLHHPNGGDGCGVGSARADQRFAQGGRNQDQCERHGSARGGVGVEEDPGDECLVCGRCRSWSY
ncbi:MAG: hypothetical protein HC853_12185 [Anaerolineae bacterium]|nr:hypothetical protein [Anaerolineae bacterium]